MANSKFSGTQKAAVLMLAFGQEIAGEIFRNLTDFEVKRIGTAMSRLGRLEQDFIDEVMLEFHEILQKDLRYYYGGADFTKNVLGSAFKGENADEIIDSLALNSASLESLELIDPKTLASFIRNEHPQTIALILAHLDAKKFGDTLKLLPEALHTEIILRVANLDAVSPDIIDELEDVLRDEVQAMGSISNNVIGGIEPIAEMLNYIDKATEEQVLDSLEERDPDLAEQIRNMMFVFDDLDKLDDRGIQELIKSVPNDKWKVALKACSESVRDLIFKNMSTRAAEMLKEDIEASPAIKLSEVEQVQFEIIQTTRKLEAEGKLIIASSDSAYV